MKLFKRHIKLDYILVLLLLTTVFSSCLKDVDTFTPYEGVEYSANPDDPELFAGDITDFFNDFAKQESTFIIDNSEGGEIILPSDNQMSFPPSAFTRIGQNSPVDGEIEIVVKEIHTKGEMVLNGKPTIAGDNLLISGGEFMVRAFKDGEELTFLEDASAIITKFTDTNQGVMNLFWGENATDEDINWIEADLPPVQADSINLGELMYQFEINDLGWINLDQYFNTDSPSSLDVKVPFGYGKENMAVFMIFKNEMSVARIHYNSARNVFSTANYKIPSGEEVVVVGIAELEGSYEYASIETFTGETLSVSLINMERKTVDEIKMVLGTY